MTTRRFALWNATDGVYAAPGTFMTREAAEDYAKAFRARYARQGYYLTTDGLRIPPESVELEVVPAEP